MCAGESGFLSIIDARDFESGHEIETDIAIVGAGAAGIATALNLGNRRIAVIESGGTEFDPKTQELYTGRV